MHYRTLGRTGLRVSEVGFGAWAIGGPAKLGDLEIGWGDVDDTMPLRAIDAAYEAGVAFLANDHRARTYPPERARRVGGQVAKLGFLTEGRHKTLAQAALQYCLSHPAVSTVIPGAKTPEQARANAGASDGVLLSADEVARARAVLAEA